MTTNKLKTVSIIMGLGTMLTGLTISLSSFSTTQSAMGSDGSQYCYESFYNADCPPNTNFTFKVNGSSTISYTIETGSTPGTWTIKILGQELSFPQRTKSGTDKITETDGTSYELTQTITNSYAISCIERTAAPNGQACAVVDCKGTVIQTYSCDHPGTGGTGGTSTNDGGAW